MHKNVWIIATLTALAVSLPFLIHFAPTVMAAGGAGPAYAANGDLLPVKNYREWVFVTSGFNMDYSPQPPGSDGASRFDNVFVNPAAYRAFLATGHWPDKTMLVLEVRAAQSKGSINQHGDFQRPGVADMAVHVKDEARFPGK